MKNTEVFSVSKMKHKCLNSKFDDKVLILESKGSFKTIIYFPHFTLLLLKQFLSILDTWKKAFIYFVTPLLI